MRITLFVLVLVTISCLTEANEKSATFWMNIGNSELKNALSTESLNKNVAKNVIILLGDGMSISTVTAARILKGQMQGQRGEEMKLAMDKFPHAALSKTYSVDRQVADSASTATAYLGGVKTNYYTVGLTAAAIKGDCVSSKGEEKIVTSVLENAWNEGKSAGIVTTTRVQHATPAAAYAHTPDRSWYSDADLTDEARLNGCKDISQQFLEASHMFKVVLGGGRSYFLPNTTIDVEYSNIINKRKDGRDIIQEWHAKQTENGNRAQYVWNKQNFGQVDSDSVDYLLGLFEPKDMQYEADRNPSDGSSEPNEPSIAEMTEKAIQILQKNPNGFFLLVEGGRIDHGHHNSNAYLALHDTIAFDKAIETAVKMTSDEDTLIIVTADHGHTLTMGGYSYRGNNIFGLAPSDENPRLGEDGKPFTTLLYANGPGYSLNDENETCEHDRENLTNIQLTGKDYVQQAAVPLSYETHGGEDVSIVARGPMAHLFHGIHEQNYIATVVRYSSCIGENKEHCRINSSKVAILSPFLGINLSSADAVKGLYVTFILLLIFAFLISYLVFINWKLKKKLEKNKSFLPDNVKMLTNSV